MAAGPLSHRLHAHARVRRAQLSALLLRAALRRIRAWLLARGANVAHAAFRAG